MGTPSVAKIRRHGAELPARILLTGCVDTAVRREFHPGTEAASVAPWNHRAERDAIHARQLADAPQRFLLEAGHLNRRLPKPITGTSMASTDCMS